MYTFNVIDAFTISDPPGTYIYDIAPVSSGIAIISSDDKIRLLDPLALSKPALSTIERKNAQFTSLTVLDEGNSVICTGGRDGSIRAFDLKSGKRVLEVKSGQYNSLISTISILVREGHLQVYWWHMLDIVLFPQF